MQNMIYYDRRGQPIDRDEWGKLFENGGEEYKRVRWDQVGEVTVSTVWIGIDHDFFATGTPLIFETMIFGGEHDGDCDRYTTEAEAIEGHEAFVRVVS